MPNSNLDNVITAHEQPGGPPPGLGLLGKLRWGVKNPPTDPIVSFQGLTVLVTGANTGLGFESGVKYAALGVSRLILGVWSAEKGESAKERILQSSGRPSSDFTAILIVDLSDFESVKYFVRALNETTTRLDVALLNAGLANPSFQQSAAGWEMGLQVNVLSTALMAILLLPLLRATAATTPATTPKTTAPHLTFVNSFGHMLAERKWPRLSGSLIELANDLS
ncbi:hypothetical protein VTI28DRAFT_8619 [Corynascus sepedonium]